MFDPLPVPTKYSLQSLFCFLCFLAASLTKVTYGGILTYMAKDTMVGIFSEKVVLIPIILKYRYL